ncbi:DM13 domain-containing protein [Streptomyces sp. NPDC097619]|uniref:DM13 domain-containing protein n=1 Tax=Streptomyces sp. NPDC097619 TaxID=3157228 RepID=UPI00331E538B
MARWRGRRGVRAGVVAVLVSGALAVGLYLFQPWKLWQDETVNEALPGALSSAPAFAPGEPGPGTAVPESAPESPPEPRTLAQGSFISHEHDTRGTAKLLRLADGSHVLRLEGLDTSNGPDLRVWLSDAPVKEGVAGWRVFDDGAHVSLGKLKGNKGDQNYAVPADVDPADYGSVAIWCDRFDVSFGAAELADA